MLELNQIFLYLFARRFADGPDRQTPYAETLKAVDDLYKEGKFNRFGLSVRCPLFVILLIFNKFVFSHNRRTTMLGKLPRYA